MDVDGKHENEKFTTVSVVRCKCAAAQSLNARRSTSNLVIIIGDQVLLKYKELTSSGGARQQRERRNGGLSKQIF